jgi:hypothetical protein
MPTDSQGLQQIYQEAPQLNAATTLADLVAAFNAPTETLTLPHVDGEQVFALIAPEDLGRLSAGGLLYLSRVAGFRAIPTDGPMWACVLALFPEETTSGQAVRALATRPGSLVEVAFGPGHAITTSQAAELAPHLAISAEEDSSIQ